MKDVTHDLDALREEWTPKQTENWENHGKSTFENLQKLQELAEEKGAEFDVETARKWYLRTYRPKKRGEGMMDRDHVKIGQPEHYFKKVMGKLNGPWGSIQGMVMASLGLSDDVREEVQDAAVAVWVAQHLDSSVDKAKLARKLQEHDKVGALYGV